ncbi:MAG TPA: DnaJ family domain-containing protein [Burkholderiales bacterium]|nr:DnaJ family domain-containing protein [Burkholderiales bacterium]
MLLFETLAEQKIRDAIERGELDNLPGAGKPLDLIEDPLIPEDMRVAYRILKNAGFVPAELQLAKEIHDLERLVESLSAGAERARAVRKLQLLSLKLDESRGRRTDLRLENEYYGKLVKRLGQSG